MVKFAATIMVYNVELGQPHIKLFFAPITSFPFSPCSCPSVLRSPWSPQR
jgi:hypothetical protein